MINAAISSRKQSLRGLPRMLTADVVPVPVQQIAQPQPAVVVASLMVALQSSAGDSPSSS
jgi:hypothetical protein